FVLCQLEALVRCLIFSYYINEIYITFRSLYICIFNSTIKCCFKMKNTEHITYLKKEDNDRFKHAFLRGISNILAFGKKPRIERFHNSLDALNYDMGFLREDLIETLIEAINELSPEQKSEFKNKLIHYEIEEGYPQMKFEFEDNSKKSKNEQGSRGEKRRGDFTCKA